MLSIARAFVFWGALLGAMSVVAPVRLARADDELLAKLPKVTEPTARAHLLSGNAHYRTKEFEAALAEYKKGLQLEDAAIFLYNIGQCNRKLQRWDDAVWVYQRFLDRAKPDAALVERVQGFIREAQQHLDEEKRAARVRPPTDVGPPSPAPMTATPTAVVPPPGGSAAPAMRLVPGEPWYRDSAGWALTGAGAIGVGVGAWMLADAADLERQANDSPMEPQRVALHDRASSRRVTGAIVGLGGVALLATGIVKLIVHPGDREEPIGTSWRIGITGDGLAILGKF
jgi:tetratricopeptide (TPR) repeat protein